MLIFEKYQLNSNLERIEGKWSLRINKKETVTIDDLIHHMRRHGSPYTEGTLKGVFADVVACIREQLLDGKAVEIPDLAVLSIAAKSKAKKTPEEVSLEDITDLHLHARSIGEMSKKNIAANAQLKEHAYYNGGE